MNRSILDMIEIMEYEIGRLNEEISKTYEEIDITKLDNISVELTKVKEELLEMRG